MLLDAEVPVSIARPLAVAGICRGGNFQAGSDVIYEEGGNMAAFLLWCILFILCWPLAILALIAYPFVWLISLPFRIVGITVNGVFALVVGDLYASGTIAARAQRGKSLTFRRRSSNATSSPR